MNVEEWRDVPGYRCTVSSKGQVRGLTKILVGWPDKDGYRRVHIRSAADNRWKQVPVHTLVALAFIGPRPSPKHEVAHGNGDRVTNEPWNLRWAVAKEQAEDRKRHGTNGGGERSGQSLLTNAQAAEIRRRYQPWCSVNGGYVLAKEYGVSRSTIKNIVLGKTYRIEEMAA